MKTRFTSWLIPLSVGLSQIANAQNVTIPDANFKNYLLSVPAINTNSDGEIQYSEAAAFTGGIYAGYKNISDLTGIQAFTNITTLDCGNNNLTSLDVSNNATLKNLDCSNNSLTTLSVTNNPALVTLGCNNNQLTGLNCSANPQLSILNCGYNNLTGLNILSNAALTSLSCENNNLPNLNVDYNPALVTLTCGNNQLPSLNVLNNLSLKYLNCQNNQITYFDLYTLSALKEIRVYNNLLTGLNVANGNNNNFTAFYATGNPNLMCIGVDNVGYMNTNWSSGKDPSAIFSTNCLTAGIATIANDKRYSVYPNPSNGIFRIRSNGSGKQTANLYDVNGKLAFNKNIQGDTEIIANDLNEGVYTLIIRSEDGLAAKKVVITR
jgi:Leucine-rich repeat (LRR) protein